METADAGNLDLPSVQLSTDVPFLLTLLGAGSCFVLSSILLNYKQNT